MKKMIVAAVAAAVLSGMGSMVSAAPAETAKPEKSPRLQPQAPVWFTRFGEAQQAARKENKAILVNFTGSDWCPWCVRLHDEVLTRKPFLDYAAKKLILLTVDFPRRKPQTAEEKQANQTLAQKYGIQGFPTVLLLDANGSVIARTGYRRGGAESYAEHLQQLLKK